MRFVRALHLLYLRTPDRKRAVEKYKYTASPCIVYIGYGLSR